MILKNLETKKIQVDLSEVLTHVAVVIKRCELIHFSLKTVLQLINETAQNYNSFEVDLNNISAVKKHIKQPKEKQVVINNDCLEPEGLNENLFLIFKKTMPDIYTINHDFLEHNAQFSLYKTDQYLVEPENVDKAKFLANSSMHIIQNMDYIIKKTNSIIKEEIKKNKNLKDKDFPEIY